MQFKRLLVKVLQYLSILNFFFHPAFPYGLKEDLIVRLKLNSSIKMVLPSGDTAETCKFSNIFLKNAIFVKHYSTVTTELYAGAT